MVKVRALASTGNTRVEIKGWLGTIVHFEGDEISRSGMIDLLHQTFRDLSEGTAEDIADLRAQIEGEEFGPKQIEAAEEELELLEKTKREEYDPLLKKFTGLAKGVEDFAGVRGGGSGIDAKEKGLFSLVPDALREIAAWYEGKAADIGADLRGGVINDAAEGLTRSVQVIPLSDEEQDDLITYLTNFMGADKAVDFVNEALETGITDDNAQHFINALTDNDVPPKEAGELVDQLRARGLSAEMAEGMGDTYVKNIKNDLVVYRANIRTLKTAADKLDGLMKNAKVQSPEADKYW